MLMGTADRVVIASRAMPPPLSPDDVRGLAALAHLELDDAEVEILTPQLAKFLEYAQQLQQIATDDVTPTTHVMTPRGRLREDDPRPSLPNDEVFANAPDADRTGGHFKVPRVIG
jgi:aspartyl-tRNA(Asn)/glutamyl-tRNA(Gln) amidotransferase subunit C